jgi:hypothetical protein
MEDLFIHRRLETRWATAENPLGARGGGCRPGNRLWAAYRDLPADDRKASPCVGPLRAGDAFTLAESCEGPGTVRRIWATISNRTPAMLRGLRLDVFWDGAMEPAVSVPFGDFFCQSLGRMSVFENALFSSPEGRSFMAILPMPFRSGFRMVVTNESGADLDLLWYEVDWTLGDEHGPDTLWLHAHWRREQPTTIAQDFVFLPAVRGRGRYLGVVFGVVVDQVTYQRTWWGEGEVKVFLDDDRAHPTLCGTGTEDYIGTGWGQGRYDHRYQGSHLVDAERMHYGFYRLHIPDPLFFQREIRATIQQIGSAGPEGQRQLQRRGLPVTYGGAPARFEKWGNFERQDDWSSCAWFYLDRPSSGLPDLAAAAERMAGLPADWY